MPVAVKNDNIVYSVNFKNTDPESCVPARCALPVPPIGGIEPVIPVGGLLVELRSCILHPVS